MLFGIIAIFHLEIQRKRCFLPIEKDGNISTGRKYYGKNVHTLLCMYGNFVVTTLQLIYSLSAKLKYKKIVSKEVKRTCFPES